MVVFFVFYYISNDYVDKKFIWVKLFVISLLSGLGNSMVIFIVNYAMNVDLVAKRNLFLLLVCALTIYIIGQKIVRYDLINLTSSIVYKKRIELIKLILNADYQKFTNINDGSIENCINSDTTVISNFTNILIGGLTNAATTFFCLAYIGILNKKGLLLICIIILLAAVVYALISQNANKSWNKARVVQNIFFQRLKDLVGGFSELYISRRKREDYLKDMDQVCKTYRDEINKGNYKFANVFIIGELVFTLVIGMISFIVPIVFYGYHYDVFSVVFMLLYIAGPINGIINMIPNLIQVRISWNKIQQFVDKLSDYKNTNNITVIHNNWRDAFDQLEVKEMVFRYDTDNKFQIGPMSLCFQKGQISFIIGGNGSGKSSFVKVLTGLYEYQEGKILVNGEKISGPNLGELFSTVLSECYLFECLYGIDATDKEIEIQKYIQELDLGDKVEVYENKFSTLQLSSGQRKRLALLVAFLEDKPIFLFDEWASNQDPYFKEVFYCKILPRLKMKGKCVIAITHDDAFFHIADQIYRMDEGAVSVVETDKMRGYIWN